MSEAYIGLDNVKNVFGDAAEFIGGNGLIIYPHNDGSGFMVARIHNPKLTDKLGLSGVEEVYSVMRSDFPVNSFETSSIQLGETLICYSEREYFETPEYTSLVDLAKQFESGNLENIDLFTQGLSNYFKLAYSHLKRFINGEIEILLVDQLFYIQYDVDENGDIYTPDMEIDLITKDMDPMFFDFNMEMVGAKFIKPIELAERLLECSQDIKNFEEIKLFLYKNFPNLQEKVLKRLNTYN